MNRAFEAKPLHQRTFFFVFKYHTALGDGLTPAPWQAHDSRPADHRSPDHIDITECSSILALSLDGDPVKNVYHRPRRKRVQQGKLYDTFAPWYVCRFCVSWGRFPRGTPLQCTTMLTA